MTSSQQTGLSSDRIRGPSGFNVSHLECSICHELVWKPVACQSCETPFCSTCIHQWLIKHPNQCPSRCQTYTERKCPPFIAKLLSQLQIACFYQSSGCNQVISYEGLDKHEIECDFQSQECTGCQSQILKKDFDNHMSNCPSIELTCQDCKLVYRRGDADRKHTENICLREQLRQLRDECKENKREIQELSLQLNEMRLLNPVIKKTRITFDDFEGAPDKLCRISVEYRELKWTGISCMHKSYAVQKYTESGYVTAFVPGNSSNIAFFKEAASISAKSPNEKFTFVSVTACAAWSDHLQLTITGHRNSIEISTYMTTLLFGKPQLILLHWKDIDKIIFKSSGGTPHSGIGGPTRTHVILTQLTLGQFD
ncbi:unnamed protein product [Rotaria sp. Silwood2]|nr:unnamed protein product [Rotaria sp. Silwood2]CAF3085540.1 unnamed protein product [Rotaria sp. Silwood2]CAF3262010.1 unnamed protein product [Rotaria sp. Silwood2]CAF3406448.1 unnamed protein product [Rotaria sp. Silwood2]CAF4075820.1 unnamed protein product [Rotaria sp. Silwood2]